MESLQGGSLFTCLASWAHISINDKIATNEMHSTDWKNYRNLVLYENLRMIIMLVRFWQMNAFTSHVWKVLCFLVLKLDALDSIRDTLESALSIEVQGSSHKAWVSRVCQLTFTQ